MAIKLADYIEKNLGVFKTLVSAGPISTSQMMYFQIYSFYKSTAHLKTKSERYELTAQTFKMSNCAIRNAVRYMETNI